MKLFLHCSLLLGATLTGCIAAVDGHNEVVNEVNGHNEVANEVANEVVELNDILNYNLFTVFSHLNIYATKFEKFNENYDAAQIADSTAAESSATGAPEDDQATTEVREVDMYDLEFATKGKSGDEESSVVSELDEMIPKEVDRGQNTHRGEDMEDRGATNNRIDAKADHYDVASDEVTRAKADAEADNSTADESPAENVYISAEAPKDDEENLNEDIKANDSEEEESDQEKVHDEQTGGEVEGADSDKGKVPVQHKDDAAATTNKNSKLKEIELTEFPDNGATSNDGRETKKERNDEPLEKKKKTKVHSNSGTIIAADGRTGESADTARETEVSTAKHDKKSVKKKAAAEKAVKAEAEKAFTEKASEAEAEKDAIKKAAEAAAEGSAADKAGEEKAAANKSFEVTEAGNGGLDDDVKDIVYTDSANFNKPTLAVGILSVLFAVVFC